MTSQVAYLARVVACVAALATSVLAAPKQVGSLPHADGARITDASHRFSDWPTEGDITPGRAFRARSPEETGVSFVHRSGAVGADKRFMIECVGTGVGLFDADDDGDLDLYLVQGGGVEPDGQITIGKRSRDSLSLNDGSGHFENAGATAGELSEGFGFGVTAADVDDDGDEDVLVTNLGFNDLLENLTVHGTGGEGETLFVRRNGAGGLAGAPTDWSMGAAFGDIDNDGDLDVYIANYLAHDLSHRMLSGQPCRWLGCEVPCGPKGLTPQGDRLYLNDGTGTFTEITQRTAVGKARPAYGFQPVFTDIDGDGDADLFISNDSMPNAFYLNRGVDADGIPQLVEQGMRSGLALSDSGKEQAGMGVAVGDVDGDGRFDLVMTNFSREPNALFRNATGEKTGALFFDEAGRFGIGRPSFFDLGWGVCLFDVELDGDRDLFIANGHVYPQVENCDISQVRYEQPDRLYHWEDERFVVGSVEADGDAAAQPGLADLMLPRASRGAAAGDLDGDGDLDLVVSVLDGAPVILENTSVHEGSWVAVDLRPMTASVGARVELRADGHQQVDEVRRGSSFMSTEPRALHFGLPRSAGSVTVTVHWPDGSTDSWADQATGRVLRLTRGTGR